MFFLILDKITAHFQLFKPCSANRREFIDAALRYVGHKSHHSVILLLPNTFAVLYIVGHQRKTMTGVLVIQN